jgi:hypothetical protein
VLASLMRRCGGRGLIRAGWSPWRGGQAVRLRTATVDRQERSSHLAWLVLRPASMVEAGPTGVLVVDDSDTYRLEAAARELEALVLYEQARRLAEVRELLAEGYARDGIAVQDTALEAEAEQVAAEERADRFLREQAGRIDQDAELLESAVQLDDHALGVWRQAAASLVEVCPPSLGHLRGWVEEERRAELRSHARLARTEAALAAQVAGFGLARRLRYRREAAELRGRLASCRRRRERSEARLGWLAAKLQVIDTAEQARNGWLADAHDVLARGVAATRVLDESARKAKGPHATPAAMSGLSRSQKGAELIGGQGHAEQSGGPA